MNIAMIWAVCTRLRRPAAKRRSAELYEAGCQLVAEEAEEERYFGCGWFDSSQDLRTGLAVIEGELADLTLAVERMLRPELVCPRCTASGDMLSAAN